MNTLDEEKSEQNSKVERVRQAAHTLGISERTVYRRLRSGKLEQLPAELPHADSVASIVSDEKVAALIQDQIGLRIDILLRQNDMTNDKMTVLHQDMANKDAQIRTLLENQQELTHTIQKLQAQIFELARLALLQPIREEAEPEEIALAVKSGRRTHHCGLRGWLRTLWGRNGER